ncbi:MAG: hypothetical protein M0C28_44990 [Candidatus Moduliflexus flocculans]|nr:hypothetical protein [Candidatus Moduliflexus flocculans]
MLRLQADRQGRPPRHASPRSSPWTSSRRAAEATRAPTAATPRSPSSATSARSKDDAFLGGFYTGREYGRRPTTASPAADGRFRLSPTQTSSSSTLFGSFTRDPGERRRAAGHALVGCSYNYANRKWLRRRSAISDISEGFRADIGLRHPDGAAPGLTVRHVHLLSEVEVLPEDRALLLGLPTSTTRSTTCGETDQRLRAPRSTCRGRHHGRASTACSPTRSIAGRRLQQQRLRRPWSRPSWRNRLYAQARVRRTDKIYLRSGRSLPGLRDDGHGGPALPAHRPARLHRQPELRRFLPDARPGEGLRLHRSCGAAMTFQLNKYLFLRGIVEYNDFYKRMTLDGLVSFTYIPGTVVHLGLRLGPREGRVGREPAGLRRKRPLPPDSPRLLLQGRLQPPVLIRGRTRLSVRFKTNCLPKV